MTAAVAEVTSPGVYDLPADVYLRDPVPGGSLSSSGARRLLPPSCPALYRHWADNPQPYNPDFSLGHAAHQMVLGAGPQIVLIEAGDWRTKAAREARDLAHQHGDIPLLEHEHQVVLAMAARLREHPIAAALFAEGSGQPEQSLFWADRDTGVRCRARLDWLPAPTTGRMLVPDYKTCASAAPDDLQKAIANYGYHQQAAFYLDAVQALGLAGQDAQFLFVFQMKTEPFLVTVVQPDRVSLQIGRYLNRQARHVYARCIAEDRWPAWSDDVEVLPLPRWVESEYRDEEIW